LIGKKPAIPYWPYRQTLAAIIMKPRLLILLGIIFLPYCSNDMNTLESIEYMSYRYILKNRTDTELLCYRYAYVKGNGSLLYYHWQKYPNNEPYYCKSHVGKKLIDKILIAEEIQEKQNQKEQELAKQGFVSLDDGPNMKIKINLRNGTYKLADFRMGDPLSKYLDSIGKEENHVPINDTIDLVKKKLQLINFIWKEDSINHKIIPPPPKD
jgi:hypothetical protein